MRILSTATFLAHIGAATAFSPSAAFTPRKSSALFVSHDTLYRAVEVAADRSFHDVDQLDKLATELEEFQGCEFEHDGKELCEKEIQDRIDVAEILRLKIELELRTDYLESANLFAEDVRKDHDAEERKKFKEALLANREKVDSSGSDLGLW